METKRVQTREANITFDLIQNSLFCTSHPFIAVLYTSCRSLSFVIAMVKLSDT
jgi:hypothetical protein